MELNKQLLSPSYKVAAKTTFWLQALLCILSALVMDGGQTAKVCGLALAGFWFCALVFAFRRPFSPTKIDLWFWNWGFLACFVLAICVAAYLHRIG
jgi:hypothetical protein